MSQPPSRSAETRALGLPTLLALGINGTVGVGIFFAPAEVMALVPGAPGALVYVVAALALWPIAIVFGRLGKHFPEDGGPYVWARAAFGPNAAFFLGWLTYVSSLLSVAAVVSGIGQQLKALLFAIDARWIALGCMLTLALLVALGLRLSAWGLWVLTALKLLPLLSLVGLGTLVALAALSSDAAPLSVVPTGAGRAVLLVVFALQGFEVVPVLAGHSRTGSSVQRATLTTLGVCTALYVLLHLVAAHAIDHGGDRATPLTAAAGYYGGSAFMRFVAAGQLLSALGIAFGQMVTTPRYLAALGRPDGFGTWLGEEHASGTPRRALGLTVVAVALLVLAGDLSSLFVLSSIAVISQYGAAVLSLLRLMAKKVLESRRAHWFLGIASLATCGLLVSYATWAELITTAGVEALGIGLLIATRKWRA